MPSYKFEAMDTSGGEVKDEIEATNEEEAQQKIKQMGYFVTKLDGSRRRQGKGQEEENGRLQEVQEDVRHRRRPHQASDALHPPVLHPSGRRPPRPPRPADSRTPDEAERPQERPHRRRRRRRIGQHALRGHGQASAGVRPALREHGPSRRGGRCSRSHHAAPRRVQGKEPDAQAQGHRGDGLPVPSSSWPPSAS